VTYASVGSGHRVAAEAIAAELEGTGSASVRLLDALEFGSPRIRGDSLVNTFTGPTAGIYDAIWGSATAGRVSRTLMGPAIAWVFRGLAAELSDIRPDVVVSTHALGSMIASRQVQAGRASYSVVNVATDYGMHGFWPRRCVALSCVADERVVQELLDRGYAPDALAATGIPVRPQFTNEYDVSAARRHFGIPENKRLVLALAGSVMPGPYERFKEALAVSLPALASVPDSSLAVVCGKDEAFAQQLRTRAAGFGTTNVFVLDYVEHMAPLMAAADLALAKPGGAVCAECLATGLPLILVGPSVGQERANAHHLYEGGAAIYAADPRTIAEYARKATGSPARLSRMRESARSMGRPFATADIVKRVLDLAAGG
jgi:processive 1,2-diacylglycerol beta-glucosyltransferase